MHVFRVWAPIVEKVDIQVDGELHPMEREQSNFPETSSSPASLLSSTDSRRFATGWWRAEIRSARAGSDYGFVLDGEGPFPDPRSQSQPDGVDGLSRVVNVASFKWTDQKWQAPPLSSAVIYELHVGTFTPRGTFDAVIEKLDHLIDLGVTHVELMPVNEFSGSRGWGYDGVDLFAPHHAYGGAEALARLVDACHARGLAVLLDVVYNHLGPVGNYLGKFGPYFTPRYSTPWGSAVNFDDAGSDEVRRFFCDNALMWLRDYHFDGLRLDAVHAIFDRSAQPFLEQLGIEVEQLAARVGRPLAIIPESDLNDPRLLWPHERGGFALHAQWSDDFHHALHSALTGETGGYYEDFGLLAHIGKALQNAFVYDGGHSRHRGRRHGRKPDGLGGRRFLGYLQNHDQIGNRAKGERSVHLMSAGRLKIAAALIFTSPFVPMLFQGEEWGASAPFLYFTDHADPTLGNQVREGRRREFAAFGWKPEEIPDPQAAETFQKSKLNWSELSAGTHAELLQWHRDLIELRRTEPALADDHLERVEVEFDEESCWLVVRRGPITVACNLAARTQSLPLRAGPQRIVMSSESGIAAGESNVTMPPDSVAILKAG